MGLNMSSGKSKSTPMDMTPEAFKGLQGPLAQRLMGLMGFTQNANPGTGTAGFNPTGAPTGIPGAGAGGVGAAGGNPKAYAYTHPGWTDTGRAAGEQNGVKYNWFQGDGATGNSTGMERFPASPPPSDGGQGNGGSSYGFNGGPDGLGGIPQYQGPLTASLGTNEKTLLDKLMQRGNGTAPDSFAIKSLKEFVNRGLNGNAAVDNPFLQSYIEAAQRPTLQGLEETLTRDLPGRFTQAGQFVQPQGSSAFDRAAAIATRGAADAVGDIATKISYNQVNDAQNRGLDAAKSIPGASAQEVDTLIQNLKAQALPRLIQEQGIDRGLALFQTRIDALLKTLGITAGATQPTIANKSESKQSGFGFSLG